MILKPLQGNVDSMTEPNKILLKPWFLYMIECEDNSIYTGIAVKVAARYMAHQNGTGARYTRSHPPRKLLIVIEYPDRSAASKAEYAMKQLTAIQKRAYLDKYSANPPNSIIALAIE